MVTMPLAMNELGFSYGTIANVVTVHALGMYIPGFVTGMTLPFPSLPCVRPRIMCHCRLVED